jgi:hypothetical protein
VRAQKAMEQDNPMRVIAKLRLLDAAGLIPGHRDQLAKLWTDDATAQLFVSAAGTKAGPAGATLPPQPCETASSSGGKVGWLYLGWANPAKTAWMATEKGTATVRFEQPTPQGPGFLTKLKGLCPHVTKAKFLRDDAPSGQKSKAPVKELVSPSQKLRILDIDDGGSDGKHTHHVIWPEVEVLN